MVPIEAYAGYHFTEDRSKVYQSIKNDELDWHYYSGYSKTGPTRCTGLEKNTSAT